MLHDKPFPIQSPGWYLSGIPKTWVFPRQISFTPDSWTQVFNPTTTDPLELCLNHKSVHMALWACSLRKHWVQKMLVIQVCLGFHLPRYFPWQRLTFKCSLMLPTGYIHQTEALLSVSSIHTSSVPTSVWPLGVCWMCSSVLSLTLSMALILQWALPFYPPPTRQSPASSPIDTKAEVLLLENEETLSPAWRLKATWP